MTAAVRSVAALPCDVATAWAALTSADWPQRKDAALSDGSRLEERTERPDGGLVLRTTRGLPAGIPGFLDKLLPKGARAGQTDTWEPAAADGARAGTWRAQVPGAPVDLHGTMRLEPTATGCDYVVEGTAKVSVPLVGGKAEKVVADLTARTASSEADLLRTLVSG